MHPQGVGEQRARSYTVFNYDPVASALTFFMCFIIGLSFVIILVCEHMTAGRNHLLPTGIGEQHRQTIRVKQRSCADVDSTYSISESAEHI
jgi:hypothetical protein